MGKEIKSFYDLRVWQEAHELALCIYKMTKTFPEDERFGLISQMRRSAGSVTANIAEGFGRYHYKEKAKFYQQARGSVMELQDQILLSKDLNYTSKKNATELFNKAEDIARGINGLVGSVKKQLEKP